MNKTVSIESSYGFIPKAKIKNDTDLSQTTVYYQEEYYIYIIVLFVGVLLCQCYYLKCELHCKKDNIIKRQRNKGLYVLSYRIPNFLFAILLSISVSIFIIISGKISKIDIFYYTDLSYLFVLFSISTLTCISFISFLASVFSKYTAWIIMLYIFKLN